MTAAAISKYILHDLYAPKVITSAAQHEQYVAALLELERSKHLSSDERNYAELLTVLIEAYEEKHHSVRAASPVETLKELMAANSLRQKDLAPIFGSESIVSEVLSGKRSFNRRQIEKLSARFHVSPELFF